MSAPDFDKNLRYQFREFDLEPSPAVWQEIESRLKKDRRRGVVFWRILAAASVIAIVSWWLYNNTEIISLPGSGKLGKGQAYNSTEKQPEKSTGKNALQPAKSSNPTVAAGRNDNTKSTPGNLTVKNQENLITGQFKPEKLVKEDAYQVSKPTRQIANSEANEGEELNPSLVDPLAQNTYSFFIDRPLPAKGEALLKDSLLLVDVIISKEKKSWHPAINTMGGGSFLQEGFLQQYRAVANEYLRDNSVPSALAGYQHLPSSVQPGLAYTLGSSINKAISRKTVVGVGLQYNYLSSNIEVGNKVDTRVTIYNSRTEEKNIDNAYYAVGENGSKYTNKYSYLQVPLSLSWNIDNMKRFWLSGGVTLGYLIYSNALQYNSISGIYYSDNDNLKKFQSGIFGGFQYQLNPKKNPGITLGPEFHYNLNSVEKNKEKKQFMYAGLTANLRFKK